MIFATQNEIWPHCATAKKIPISPIATFSTATVQLPGTGAT